VELGLGILRGFGNFFVELGISLNWGFQSNWCHQRLRPIYEDLFAKGSSCSSRR